MQHQIVEKEKRAENRKALLALLVILALPLLTLIDQRLGRVIPIVAMFLGLVFLSPLLLRLFDWAVGFSARKPSGNRRKGIRGFVDSIKDNVLRGLAFLLCKINPDKSPKSGSEHRND